MKLPARKVAPAAVLCHAIVDHHPDSSVSSADHPTFGKMHAPAA